MAPPEQSPISKLVRHVRWRTQQSSRALHQLAVLDLHRDPSRGLHLAGWQRSGSTWLARMTTSAASTRMVYEPSNLRHGLLTGGEPHLHPLPLAGPDDELGVEGVDVIDALAGRISTTWTHSIIDLGWNADPSSTNAAAEAQDPEATHRARQVALLDEVGRWASNHGFTLRHSASAAVHVILYEHLVEDPRSELERLGQFLTRFPTHWGDWAPDLSNIEAPSKTSFRRTETTAAGWIDSWSSRYETATLEAAQRLLAAEGLDRVYGASNLPLLSGDKVLDAMAP